MNKLLKVTAFLVASLLLSVEFLKDGYIQIFVTHFAWMFALKRSFGFQLNPLKVFAFAVIAVTFIQLGRRTVELHYPQIADGSEREQFIVDWGISGAPMKCGGNMPPGITPPTHTAVCDIWSDPEKIIDQKVEHVLNMTSNKSREMESYLRIDTPDKRERSKEGHAEGMIV